MLYPQRNKHRQFIELSGFWDFRFDTNNKGLDENWKNGFINSRPKMAAHLLHRLWKGEEK